MGPMEIDGCRDVRCLRLTPAWQPPGSKETTIPTRKPRLVRRPGPGLDTRRIAQLIEPTIRSLGHEVVRVQLSGSYQQPTLQIMIEREDRADVTVEHCAEVSRAVSAVLDVADPVDNAYVLEVSSPGIDRPLTRPQDFERFAGYEARIETDRAVDGRKRFRGQLIGLVDTDVVIEVDGERWSIPFGDVARAKLVLTDELLAQAAAAQGLAPTGDVAPPDQDDDPDAADAAAPQS